VKEYRVLRRPQRLRHSCRTSYPRTLAYVRKRDEARSCPPYLVVGSVARCHTVEMDSVTTLDARRYKKSRGAEAMTLNGVARPHGNGAPASLPGSSNTEEDPTAKCQIPAILQRDIHTTRIYDTLRAHGRNRVRHCTRVYRRHHLPGETVAFRYRCVPHDCCGHGEDYRKRTHVSLQGTFVSAFPQCLGGRVGLGLIGGRSTCQQQTKPINT